MCFTYLDCCINYNSRLVRPSPKDSVYRGNEWVFRGIYSQIFLFLVKFSILTLRRCNVYIGCKLSTNIQLKSLITFRTTNKKRKFALCRWRSKLCPEAGHQYANYNHSFNVCNLNHYLHLTYLGKATRKEIRGCCSSAEEDIFSNHIHCKA